MLALGVAVGVVVMFVLSWVGWAFYSRAHPDR